jgi:hypothetical protein
MSDLFLKNSVKNSNFANSTESSFNVGKVLNINSAIKNSVTSSAIMKTINDLSSTSYNNTQVGGASITSSANLSKINSNDINNLLSMLTSESNVNTTTENLENKLKNLLAQEGGEYESTEMIEQKLKGLLNNTTLTEEMSTERLEAKINNIQRGGAKSIFGLAGLAAVGAANKYFNTETEDFNAKKILDKPIINSSNDNFSATSSEMPPAKPIFTKAESKFTPSLATTTEMPSSATSPMSDERVKILNQEGGDNTALVAFREISKMVSEKLKISNGPNCKKIAGQLQRDVKEKMPEITHDKLVAAAKKHLESNVDKYQNMV